MISTQALLWFLPLLIGVVLAIINTDKSNEISEKSETWFRRQYQALESAKGWFKSYIIKPLLWLVVKFSDWTDGLAHRGLKNGLRVALTLYVIAFWLYLIIAAFMIIVSLAIAIFVIYIVTKVVLNSGNNEENTGRNIFTSTTRMVTTGYDKEDDDKQPTKEDKKMSTFSVKVIWQNGHPASDVGVMISYLGALSGYDEKRTGNDGWVTFTNYDNQPGEIWVHGHNFGSHSLSNGKTYSYTI